MKVIEQFIKGKRENEALCEDGLFVNDDYICVIDGVTSKGKQTWNGIYTSGGFAKEIILKTLADMPGDADKKTFFDALDNALALAYDAQVQNDSITEYLRACIIVYSVSQKKIWSLGDCACIINGQKHETPKVIDSLLSSLRAFVIESAVKDSIDLTKGDVGREAIVPFLNKQLLFENDDKSHFGYGVLNGHGVNVNFITEYDVKTGDSVVLASDGYPDLCDSLQASEMRLQELLKIDPMCVKENISTKGIDKNNCSFDDRTYIKFEV